jgi:SMP-30/Gluconolactonase/LRE-like region
MKTIAMLLCVAGLAACDDDTTSMMQQGNMDMSATVDLAVQRSVDIALTFQPEGLWWDSGSQTLYIANDGGQQIVKWNEPGTSFSVFARLPEIAASAGSLGQLIKTKDGSWLVTRFGFSQAGAVLQTSSDGQTVTTVAGLDVKRRRIGLTQATDGTVFVGWFTTASAASMMPMNGTVSKLALDGSGETDLVTGIGKPVGVLALGDQLYISDQMNGLVLKTPLASPGTTTTFATVEGADELAAGSGGVIYAVTHTGTVWSIASDGTTTMIKDGYKPLRGVAWDGDHKRLFISEPDSGNPDGGAGMPMLHVLAID